MRKQSSSKTKRKHRYTLYSICISFVDVIAVLTLSSIAWMSPFFPPANWADPFDVSWSRAIFDSTKST